MTVHSNIMQLGFHISKTIVTRDGKKRARDIDTACKEDMRIMDKSARIARDDRHPAHIQVFVTGPQSFTETLTTHEKAHLSALVAAKQVSIVVHGSYADSPWGRNDASIHNIKKEMNIAANIGATGVIVHMGKGLLCDAAMDYVFSKIGELPRSTLDAVTLWLEIHVAKPSMYTFETPSKLQALFERVTSINKYDIKVGLCVDTAHLFSCGVALVSHADAVGWFDEVSNAIGDTPIMIHLNDSDSTLGSGIDRHAGLTLGNLWGLYGASPGGLPIEESGLCGVLSWADEHAAGVVIERDHACIKHDLDLIAGMGYL